MLIGNLDLDTMRIITAISMLAVASFLDIRKREINDILWIGFGAVAFVMIFVSGDIWSTLRTTGVAMIIAPIALVVWRLGIFGGADAFCLIALGALAPMASIYGSMVTPITTLTNAAILSIVPLFVNLGRNLFAMSKKEEIFKGFDETRLNKVIAVFVGYRAKSPKYGFSIEKTEGNKKRLDLGFRHAENTQFCTESETWITPGIPYIIYIAGGFVIQIFYGDIIVNLVRSIH
ncbi:MAG: prepilin peptidase [Nitrosotalea sp.]